MFLTLRLPVAAVLAALVGVLVSVATGWPVASTIAAADGVLVFVVLADIVLAPSPASLRPAREMPDAASIGESETVSVVLQNPTRRALRVAVRDASPPSLQRRALTHSTVVPAGRRLAFDATVSPLRRGRIPLGPITVRVAGPAGLAGRQQRIDDRTALKVFPALPGRAEVELRITRARLLQSGERSSAVRGGGTEFDSLREYHPDDEFRRINWRATARASKTISNVFREERNQNVLLLLDAGRLMAGTVEGVSRFEHAVDAAMAVAELAARIGDHVGMAAFARDLLTALPPRGGRTQAGRILNALYTIEPTLDAPNYPQVFSSLLTRYRRRSLIMLITELTDVTAMESLLAAVPALVRRHLVVVGAVTDPSVEKLALSVPASSEDAYFKAASAGALDARAGAAAQLRAIGAVVVDRPPGALAGALADHYLRVKAYGRL